MKKTTMMTMNDIVEGNKLIAVFMGYTYFPHNMEGVTIPGWKTTIDTHCVSKFNSSHNLLLGGAKFIHKDGTETVILNKRDEQKRHYLCRSHKYLMYHSSWDWLMDVVDKISQIDLTCKGNDFIHEAQKVCLLHVCETRENVWLAVVNFVKWYNKNKIKT